MKPTIEVILLETVLARPVCEVLRTRHAEVLTWRVYRHDDSLESLREAGFIEHSANLLRCCLIFAQGLRPPGIEIGIQSEGGHNNHTLALVIVGGFDEWAPVYCRGFEALQGTNAIVAAGERLKHEEAHLGS